MDRRALDELLSSLPGAVQQFILRPDGTHDVPYVSEGVEGLTGMRPEELSREPDAAFESVVTEDIPRLKASIRDAAESMSTWWCEYRVRHKDGSLRWAMGVGLPRRLEDGSTVLNTFNFDITDRKRAEDRLEALRRKYDQVFQSSSVFFWIIDANGIVLEVNARAREAFGHELGRHLWAEDVWNLEPEHMDALLQAVRSTAEVSSLQFPLTDRSEPYDIALTLRPLKGDRGQTVALVVEGRDVTPLESRERFLQSLELSARVAEIGAFAYVHDRRAVEMSPQSAAIVGLDATSEVSVERFFDLFASDHRDRVSDGFQRVAERSRREWEFEARLDGDPNEPRYVRLWLHREEGMAGGQRLSGVVQDVTQQRIERESAQHAQRLESLGRLAGGVAHDFNNLLTTMLGSAELLKGETDPAVVDELAGEILLAAERGRALTRRLLTVARRQEGQRRRTDLGALIKESAPLWLRMLGEQVKLELDIEPGTLTVFVDPRQIDQVLMNLLINAKDAMPEGGTVGLDLRSSPPPPQLSGVDPAVRWCRVTVRDDGMGMPAEAVERAFEPFFTTKGQGKGTGLGLATSYAIVRQCGGAFHLESQPNDGTLVQFWLPCTDQDPTGDLPATTDTPTSLRRRTIMVLEDDLGVGQTMLRMLERLGFRVVLVHTADEAFAAARAESIDLLVSDVVMPDVSGPGVAARLRDRFPGLKVLFVSGYAGTELERHGWDPQTPLLSKPFTAEELFTAVTDLL
jgi:PAS domain S-box-containing protein